MARNQKYPSISKQNVGDSDLIHKRGNTPLFLYIGNELERNKYVPANSIEREPTKIHSLIRCLV